MVTMRQAEERQVVRDLIYMLHWLNLNNLKDLPPPYRFSPLVFLDTPPSSSMQHLLVYTTDNEH